MAFPEVAPRAFLFHEQDPLPEEVDEPALVAQQFYGFFERRHPPHRHAEYVEEVPVEKLRLALFVAGAFPLAGKFRRTGAYFIPGQAHALGLGGSSGALTRNKVAILHLNCFGIC